MKYILIAIMALSTTAQAKSFSQFDYAMQTGKIPVKVEKKVSNFEEMVSNTALSITKLERKREVLTQRIQDINATHSKQVAKISRSQALNKDTRQASQDRNSRLFIVRSDIAKVDKRISELKDVLSYYELCIKVEKIGKGLKVRRLITSIS